MIYEGENYPQFVKIQVEKQFNIYENRINLLLEESIEALNKFKIVETWKKGIQR